jgi:hypothetical protein
VDLEIVSRVTVGLTERALICLHRDEVMEGVCVSGRIEMLEKRLLVDRPTREVISKSGLQSSNSYTHIGRTFNLCTPTIVNHTSIR